jgi:hypothetical protein
MQTYLSFQTVVRWSLAGTYQRFSKPLEKHIANADVCFFIDPAEALFACAKNFCSISFCLQKGSV